MQHTPFRARFDILVDIPCSVHALTFQKLREIDRRCCIAGRRTFRIVTRVAFGQHAERCDRVTGVIRLKTSILMIDSG